MTCRARPAHAVRGARRWDNLTLPCTACTDRLTDAVVVAATGPPLPFCVRVALLVRLAFTVVMRPWRKHFHFGCRANTVALASTIVVRASCLGFKLIRVAQTVVTADSIATARRRGDLPLSRGAEGVRRAHAIRLSCRCFYLILALVTYACGLTAHGARLVLPLVAAIACRTCATTARTCVLARLALGTRQARANGLVVATIALDASSSV